MDNARRTGAALEAHFQFLLWLIPAVARFPRSQKLLLTDRIQSAALDVLDSLVEATYTRERRAHLARANLGIEKLRFLFRLAVELHYIDPRRYEHAARTLDDIGRQVGGWLRASRLKSQSDVIASGAKQSMAGCVVSGSPRRPRPPRDDDLSSDALAAMEIVNIHEAKTRLSRLVEQAAKGEPFIIAKAGKPLVKVTAIDALPVKGKRRLGFMAGLIAVPDDFHRMGRKEIEHLFADR
jgi:prevent-host-death family protein